MPADIGKGFRVPVDEQRLHISIALLFKPHLFREVGGEVGGRSTDFSAIISSYFPSSCLPSDMIEAPNSLNNLHRICIVNDLSAGSEGCPLRINAVSPVRSTPGVWIGPFPFVSDEVCEASLAVTASAAKFLKSDRGCPDMLETSKPPSVSSPIHRSGAVLFTANTVW